LNICREHGPQDLVSQGGGLNRNTHFAFICQSIRAGNGLKLNRMQRKATKIPFSRPVSARPARL